MRLALAQFNPVLGALADNQDRILALARQAEEVGADLVLFPELALCGYPPEDLVLRSDFLQECERNLHQLCGRYTGKATLVVGSVGMHEHGGAVHNCLYVIQGQQIIGRAEKLHLPNYGVFDEKRVFEPGRQATFFEVADKRIGLTICEDLWVAGGPAEDLAAAGCALILNASASPYHVDKLRQRQALLSTRALESGAALAYCNLVGGQDELIFDGGSMVYDQQGQVLAQAPQFVEHLLLCDVNLDRVLTSRRMDARVRGAHAPRPTRSLGTVLPTFESMSSKPPLAVMPVDPLCREEELYRALTLALADYHRKIGFRGALLGLSGGVDSALAAALAVDALGAENVTCVVMPSPYSSQATQQDAIDMAKGLGADLRVIPIEGLMRAFEASLDGQLGETYDGDVTEENLQARIRGNLLMAISNREGQLVVTTGNKSETAVGYCTLFGDMAGGFALLKDLPKLDVFRLCEWRNAQSQVIPQGILDRPPSAELAHGQADSDSLPPYEILDPILELLVQDNLSAEEAVAQGFDPEVVQRVEKMLDRAEYKRRQGAPGPKVTTRAFGKDRRVPIVNHFTRQETLRR